MVAVRPLHPEYNFTWYKHVGVEVIFKPIPDGGRLSSSKRWDHDHCIARWQAGGRGLDQSGGSWNKLEEGDWSNKQEGQSHQDVSNDGDNSV